MRNLLIIVSYSVRSTHGGCNFVWTSQGQVRCRNGPIRKITRNSKKNYRVVSWMSSRWMRFFLDWMLWCMFCKTTRNRIDDDPLTWSFCLICSCFLTSSSSMPYGRWTVQRSRRCFRGWRTRQQHLCHLLLMMARRAMFLATKKPMDIVWICRPWARTRVVGKP